MFLKGEGMMNITIQFEKEDTEYFDKRIPLEVQTYLNALSKGYDIDLNILYHIFVFGMDIQNNKK